MKLCYSLLLQNTGGYSLETDKKYSRYSIILLIDIFLICYALFGTAGLKKQFGLSIDGIRFQNLIYIVPIVLLIRAISKQELIVSYSLFWSGTILTLYTAIHSLVLFNSQSVYAALLIIIPYWLLFTTNNKEANGYFIFTKIIIVLCLVYSAYSIAQFFMYNSLVRLIGRGVISADYQTRHSTLLGSSITTSYFFVISIPMMMMGLQFLSERWKKRCIVSIGLSCFSVILLQSRISFVVLAVYFIIYFLKYGKKIRTRYKILVIIAVCALLYWTLTNDSLSRLYTSYLGGESTEMRFRAIETGLHAFQQRPLFGSGLAKYYKRLWDSFSRNINIFGEATLVDPHNMYIFLLDEIGAIGIIIYLIAYYNVYKQICSCNENIIVHNVRVLFIGLGICMFGGSQLVNELPFSVIFHVYMCMLLSVSQNIVMQRKQES